MKILMITEKDAANASLSKIANAFIKQKHEVTVYAPYYSDNVLNCFDKDIVCYPFTRLSREEMDNCDCIFASSMADSFLAEKDLLSVKKPVFTHNYLINKQVVWGGDVCFAASLESARSHYDPYLNHTRIAIGEPKYDTKTVKRQLQEGKTFLYIDSGHYPFSEQGKREVARTLTAICEHFPEWHLVIKPRFLPNDKIITHRNLLNLNDLLIEESGGKLPANMEVLKEHLDLMELIQECDTVICLYTTSFAGAVAAHKGLVIMEGFDSEDVYDVRDKIFHRIRENMAGSGALVHYKNVFTLLPEGVRVCQEYTNYLFAEEHDAADKICEVTEYIYREFYDKGLFPDKADCNYRNYKNIKPASDKTNWNEVILNRKRNYLTHRILIHLDFHVSTALDTTYLNQFIQSADLKNGNFIEYLNMVPEVRSKIITENKDKMIQNDIDAGVLLNALYILKRYDEIIDFSKTDIGAYFLFLGFTYADLKQENNMVSALVKYFEISDNRAYIKEISDMSNNRFKAFDLLIHALINMDKRKEALWYHGKMKEYYLINYLVDATDDSVTDPAQKMHCDLVKWYDAYFKNN